MIFQKVFILSGETCDGLLTSSVYIDAYVKTIRFSNVLQRTGEDDNIQAYSSYNRML